MHFTDAIFRICSRRLSPSAVTRIKRPVVIVIARGRRTAFVKSVNGEESFAVARCDSDTAPVAVDLLVFETGL